MDNTTLTTTDHAAHIRQTLKAQHGWNSRQVSVRADYYSMGSSIHVTIKDASIPSSLVRAIAERAERIDRDGFGEILSGCNRYVDVGYDGPALKALGSRWLGAIDAAYLELHTTGENSLIPIQGTPYLLGYDGHRGQGFSLWQDGHQGNYYDLACVAEGLGVKMVNAITADAKGGVQ